MNLFSRSSFLVTLSIVIAGVPLPVFGLGESIHVNLAVDATEAVRNIFHVKESFPVSQGPLTLLFPEWIPGEHGPTGPVTDLVGLHISAGGHVLPWRRDLVDMYALHLDVPADQTTLDLTFDFITSPVKEGFSAGASATPQLAMVSWNELVLYPAGIPPDSITVAPSVQLPAGWKMATALDTDREGPGPTVFHPVTLNVLIDSPVLAGAHFRRIDVSPANGIRHSIDLVADGDEELEMSPTQADEYSRLVREANALFGSFHYRHYDFLFTLSDGVAHYGLEHHQCSDDRVAGRTLVDPNLWKTSVTLLPHEYVHSWNGKYRRPAGLATGDFSTPMKGDLLWVYEGLTQYLGKLLAARSGLRTPEEYREDLAMVAARLDNRPGREWRPLQDCADEAQLLYSARSDWDALRRATDFYDEGDLIWLETDATIRQLTSGKRSLNEFCRKFHGGESGKPITRPYTFDDVVAALDEVAKYDWASFLKQRLESLGAHAPLGGIEKGGWRLVYREEPGALEKATEESRKQLDARYSLGFYLDNEGTLVDVIPGSPADKAGLAPGMKLVAVAGRKYTKEILRAALREGKSSTLPLEVLCVNGEYFKTYSIDYHGGERYPALERDKSRPDLLDMIVKPITR